MKIYEYLLVSAFLFLQTSLCFAEKSINFSIVPDRSPDCSQLVVDVAMSEHTSLGISPLSCNSDRPAIAMAPNSNVRNQVNRIVVPWRYSPRGVFKDGFYFMASLGIENDQFNSTAGSTANVFFLGSSLHTGYQWFWKNGFNITLIFSASHLTQMSLDRTTSPTESPDVVDFLDQNTSSNTHYSVGPLFGWAF
jgi:hypothetical protein